MPEGGKFLFYWH